MLADGILVRPELAREHLTDNHIAARAGNRVAVVKIAAAQERNSQSLEIAGRHRGLRDPSRLISLGHVIP